MTKQPREANGRWASNPFASNPGRDNAPKAAPAVKEMSGVAASPGLNLALALESVNLERAKLEQEQKKREQEQKKREQEQRARVWTKKDGSKYAPLFYAGSLHQEPEHNTPQIQDQLQQVATDASARLETLVHAAYLDNNTNHVHKATDNLVEKLARVPSRDSKISYRDWVEMNIEASPRSRSPHDATEVISSYAHCFNEDELRGFAEDFAVIGAAPVAKPAFFSKMKRDGETFFVSVYEEDGDFYIETTHAQSSETYREVVTDANKRAIAEKMLEQAEERHQRAKEAHREWKQRRRDKDEPWWREKQRLQEELKSQWDKVWDKRHAEDALVEQARRAEAARVEQERQAEEKARRKARRKEIWTGPLFKKSN